MQNTIQGTTNTACGKGEKREEKLRDRERKSKRERQRIIQGARKEHKSLAACRLDLANAYNIVHHSLIDFSLKHNVTLTDCARPLLGSICQCYHCRVVNSCNSPLDWCIPSDICAKPDWLGSDNLSTAMTVYSGQM